MKKITLIVSLLLLFLVAGIRAQELSRTIHLKVAGTLPDSISGSEKSEITHLTLTGDLNGTDIRFIREMGGVDVNGNPTESKLDILDMGNARIVAGGEFYIYNSSYQTKNDVLGYSMFQSCRFRIIVIPSTTSQIDTQAFNNCVNLVSVTIPDKVTEIASGAYYGCTSLKDLILADGLEILNITGVFDNFPIEKLYLGRNLGEQNPFFRNQTLASVEIGNAVTSMNNSMFYGCTNLKSVIIGNGVSSINSYTFGECTSLKEVSIVDGNKVINLNISDPFSGTALEKLYVGRNFYNGSMASSYLKEIILGDSVTYISQRAFSGCNILTSISIPANDRLYWRRCFYAQHFTERDSF